MKFTLSVAVLALVASMVGSSIPATAHHKSWHNPPGHAKESQSKHLEKAGKRGGPPPWAAAHGYRGKKVRYRHDGEDRVIEPETLLTLPQFGSATCNKQRLGEVLGGIAGAAAGSKIGKGDGKTLATLGGTIIGVLIGGSIGRQIDTIDQNCIGQALERAPTGEDVMWRNLDRGGQFRLTPTNTFQTSAGQYCRDYRMTVSIAGRPQDANGTACRRVDGSWKRVF
jgi:surface antigen